jgi:glucose-6-phosphate dehydrogenase assembly protein OpcA
VATALTLSSIREIEQEVAALRRGPDEAPRQRTSVMTHLAWVPGEWVVAAEDVLSGLAERHPSRTVVLLPQPDADDDGMAASVQVECHPAGGGREICTETIRIELKGKPASVPESVVQPLLLPDLPVFLRWRGVPPFGAHHFEGLIGVVDRLIVDSTEWPDLPAGYAELVDVFAQVVVSDIAWARTSRWRTELASLWPGIADVSRVRVVGTAAQANLLAGWLRSRLKRSVELEHEAADKLVAVDVDGEPAPFPPGEAPDPADLLSEELDRFTRDPIYEAAVAAAART